MTANKTGLNNPSKAFVVIFISLYRNSLLVFLLNTPSPPMWNSDTQIADALEAGDLQFVTKYNPDYYMELIKSCEFRTLRIFCYNRIR